MEDGFAFRMKGEMKTSRSSIFGSGASAIDIGATRRGNASENGVVGSGGAARAEVAKMHVNADAINCVMLEHQFSIGVRRIPRGLGRDHKPMYRALPR
jgi:hypothetical protein